MTRIFIAIILFFIMCMPVQAEQKPSVSAEAFGQLAYISSLKLSPDGKKIAALMNVDGRIGLLTKKFNSNDPKDIFFTDFPKGEFNWYRWANNNRLIISVRFPSKRGRTRTRETRLVAIDWDQKNQINLIKSQRKQGKKFQSQIQDSIVSMLPDDDDHVLLSLDDSIHGYPDVFKVNIHTAKRAAQIRSRQDVAIWKADAKGVLRLGYSINPRAKTKAKYIYRRNKDASWETLVKEDLIDRNRKFTPVGFSADENIIYIFKPNEYGNRSYYYYDVANKKILDQIAGRENMDIRNLIYDENGQVNGYEYYDGKLVSVYFDKKDRQIQALLKKNFPDHVSIIVSHDKAKHKFIILVTSPVQPGRYFYLDIENRILRFYGSRNPSVDQSKLSPMKNITFKARDGLDIPAYLSLPKNSKKAEKLPTVILPHGGPRGRDRWGYDYWVQFLTTRGYAVLQVNYRGSTGYSMTFRDRGYHEWGGRMLDDINDGARWLIAQGIADKDRLCIMGGSYGGYAALQSLVKEPGLYKCSIAFAPVTDVYRMLGERKKFMFSKWMVHYVKSDEQSLSEISPIRNIKKINIPILLLHGTKDRVVLFQQGKNFANALRSKKKDIRFVKFEEGDHYLSKQEHRIEFLKEVENFLEKNL